jgi:hypothetical protein
MITPFSNRPLQVLVAAVEVVAQYGPPPRYSSTVARSNPIRPAQAGLEVMVSTLAVKEESVARAVPFVPWAA